MRMLWLGRMAGLAALTAAVATSHGCSQAKPECTVGSASGSPFTARLALVDGDPESACGQKKSLTLGMQVYHPDAGGSPDRSTRVVAIQTLGLSAAPRDDAAKDKPYALGTFTSLEPDEHDICTIPTFEPAQGTVPPEGTGGSGDGGTGGADPGESRSVKYEWSNMRVYVTAANLGNQFEADLTYTEEGCTAKYKVVGVWPRIDCQIYEANPDPEGLPMPTGEKDDAICDDPASGLSPDLRVTCDPDPEQQTFTCALDAETIPAFR